MQPSVIHHRDRLVDLQTQMLPGVSRTFALTIPQLPNSLNIPVTNAYLLCRAADTIEDDRDLDASIKTEFHNRLVAAVRGEESSDVLAKELAPLLGSSTPQAEIDLIRQLPDVIALTHMLPDGQRMPIDRCIDVMCAGMPQYAHGFDRGGLPTIVDLGEYCYFVAGVVGEMLTELFCDYSDEIAEHRDHMMPLSVRFGQGLQMTNILKDFWEDRLRDACWLPRELFAKVGLDLRQPENDRFLKLFPTGLLELVGIAHGCLRDAMHYVSLVPSREVGIRKFCLWSIGLAVLTLQNIRRKPTFRSAEQVKVSRPAVKATIMASNMVARSDAALNLLFRLTALGLPKHQQKVASA